MALPHVMAGGAVTAAAVHGRVGAREASAAALGSDPLGAQQAVPSGAKASSRTPTSPSEGIGSARHVVAVVVAVAPASSSAAAAAAAPGGGTARRGHGIARNVQRQPEVA